MDKWNVDLITGPRVTMPMKPITTDGMAARSSMPAFRISLVLRGAISAMYRALATPRGTEIAAAPSVTSTEPSTSGNTPNCGGSDMGYQFAPRRNWKSPTCRKTARPSFSRNRKMSTTITIEVMPLRKITRSIHHSWILRKVMEGRVRSISENRDKIHFPHNLLPFR